MDKKIIIAALVAAVVVVGGAAVYLAGEKGNGEDNNLTITGDMLVEGLYTLKDKTYEYITIASSVGDGSVKFENVHILRDLIINGGGSHSITLDGCSVDGTTTVDASTTPRINLVNGCELSSIVVTADVILDSDDGNGSFGTVTATGAVVTINAGAVVENIAMNGGTADVKGEVATIIQTGGEVTITGEGSVDTFNANGTAVVESSVVSSVVVAEGAAEANLSVTGSETVDVKINSTGVIIITTSEESNVNLSTDLADAPQVTVDGEVIEHFHKYEFLRFEWDEVRYTCQVVLVCSGCEESEPGHFVYEKIRLTISGTNPTCTVDGYTEYTAVFGENTDSRRSVDLALGHDLEEHAGKAATCTESGYNAYHTCKRCDYTDYEEIPPLGHDLIHVGAKEATITEEGHNAYDYCSRCDYSTKVVIPRLEGGINVYVYGGTPSAEGYTLAEVSGMGAVKCLVVDKNTVVTIDKDEVAGKTFREWTSDRGDFIGVESFTLLAETDTYIFANYEEDLVFGEWVIVSEPDCETTGLAYRETADGSRQYAVLYPMAHDGWACHRPINTEVIREPTCTEDGLAKAVCAECGNEYSIVIEALGHSLDEGRIIKEADGAVVGQKEYRCTRDGCDYSDTRDYIKPTLPSGEFNIYMTTENHDSGWSSRFNRFEWHTSTVNSEGKQAYLYIFTALNLKEDGIPIYSILLWIDEGEHSPVYVRHGAPSLINESYGGWGIIEYCDSYDEFIEYLDIAPKGGDDGYTNSLLYDLFNYYADGLNAEWFLKREDPNGDRYYTDKENTSVPGYQTLLVDENNCAWVYTMEGGSYNRVEYARTYPVPSEMDRENYSCQVYTSSFYPYRLIESVKERSEITYFQETLTDNNGVNIQDHRRDDRFHHMTNVIGSFDLTHNNIPNYGFVEYQILGLDGNWYYLTNEDHQDHIDVGNTRCNTIVELYDALSQIYGTEVFVPVTDAKFDNIHIRGYYEEIPAQCQFTLVHASCEIFGEVMTSGSTHIGDSIYIESDRIPGKVLSGWKVTRNGTSDTQNYCYDLYFNAFDEAGTYVIEALYEDDQPAEVEVSVIGNGFVYYDGSIFSERTISGFCNESFVMQPVNGYGSHFVGWKVTYRENGEGGEIVESDLEDIYGPLRDQKLFENSFGDIESVAAVFVDDLDYYDVVATNGFVMNPDYKLEGINGYKVSDLRVYFSNQYNLMLGLVSDPNKGTVYAWDITEEGEETVRNYTRIDEPYEIVMIFANTAYDGVLYSDLEHYTVTFEGAGNTGGSMISLDILEGNDLTLPECGFVKEGYNFQYWMDEYGSYEVGEYITLSSNRAFTAVWEIDTCFAEFHVDAYYDLYHLSSFGISVTYGETATIPANVLQYAYGFHISGWHNPVVDVTYPADGTGQLPYGVKDLYAVIDYDEVTLHFIKGSESVRGTMDDLVVRVGADEKAVIPEGAGVFSNPGYMFAGWYVDGSPFGYDIDEFSLVDLQGYGRLRRRSPRVHRTLGNSYHPCKVHCRFERR